MDAATKRPPRVTYTEHPNGPAHTRATIAKMAKLVREGSQTYEMRHLATEITHHVPSKSPTLELAAIYRWVRDNIRYRYDPLELEWVQAPARTVLERAGDCDDMTVLIATLAASLGHPWRFRTVGATREQQAHVGAQCWDRKVWLDLDPVLEPPQPTTAPRSDLGMFGLRARGASILWGQEGSMLQGVPSHRARAGRVHRMRVKAHHLNGLGAPVSIELAEELFGPGPLVMNGLGAPVSARLAELWYWQPYYPVVPPVDRYGMQPPQVGVYPTPDPRYRSPNAPGFQGGEPIVLSLPVGSISEGYLDGDGWCTVPVEAPGLGRGFLKKLKRGIKKVGKGVVKGVQKAGQLAHKVTHTGPIAKAEKWLQDAASKTVVLKPFVDFHKKIAAPLTEKALKKVGLIKGKTKKLDVKGGLKAAASAAASRASSSAPALKALPAPAAKLAAKARPVAKVVAKAKPVAKLATKKSPLAVKLPSVQAAVKKAQGGINKALRAKYPKNARQVYDKALKRYRVFVPVSSSVHGLGALRPSFTIAFGGLGGLGLVVAPSARPDVVEKAKKALSAVNTFRVKHANKSPAVHIPAVQAFQVAEKGLAMDGLYGGNTRAAMAYYLPKGTALPAPAPALNGKVTWQPPQAPAPKPVAPKPVAVKPVAPKPVAVKPVAPKPVAVKPVAPKPVASTTVPAGYKEVGQEAQNPGFPPVGAETQVGTARGSSSSSPSSSSPSSSTVRTPVKLPPPGPGTTQTNMTQRIDMDAGTAAPIVVDGGKLVDMAPAPPLPDVDTRPQPSYPVVTNWPGERKAGSDDTWLWLAAAYLYWKRSQKRAA